MFPRIVCVLRNTEAKQMGLNQSFKNLKSKKGFPVVLLLLGLTLGVVVAQIFSNQLSYNFRVKDDNERYSVTELTSSMSDLWGSGEVSVSVHIEKFFDPASSILHMSIWNMENKSITPADFSAEGYIRHGDGTVLMSRVPLGSSVLQPGGIIQGGNSSTVIVWSAIDFTQVNDPNLIRIALWVNFLATVASGNYQVTVFVYS